MFVNCLKLFAYDLIPLIIAVVFGALENYCKPFYEIKRRRKLIIVGIVFGLFSILGSVLTVDFGQGAYLDGRNISPILAGLMFGGPSGIIAGSIGGIYRFVSVYWGGASQFTQYAASLSTIMAGVFTAIIRKFVFNGHHGKWYYGFFLGILVEDFYLMLMYVFGLNHISEVYNITHIYGAIMSVINSVVVMVALILVSIVFKEKLFEKKSKRTVATKIQVTLICSILVGYTVVSMFTYETIKKLVSQSTKDNTAYAINDVQNEVNNDIDSYFKTLCFQAETIFNDALEHGEDLNAKIAQCLTDYKLSEINLVSTSNRIKYSSFQDYVDMNEGEGFDMTSGEQSNEFTCLNEGVYIYVQEFREPTSEMTDRVKFAGIQLEDHRVLSDEKYRIGYVQIGLYEEAYYTLVNEELFNVTGFKHINQKGFIVIAVSNGEIISTLFDGPLSILEFVNIKDFKQNEQIVYRLKNVDYYVYTVVVEGYYIIGFANKNECDMPLNTTFAGITIAEIFMFLILYCVIYIFIKKRVVDPLANVSNRLDEISNGNLEVKVNEHNTFEFESLSNDINKTVGALKGYIEKEATKNAEELELAMNIQHSVLPTIFPLNDKFEIYASMVTAKQVGGDFYDFYYVDREHIVIQIADVSGKGIPAAMFMMEAKTILKSLIETGMDIGEAFTEANKRLCEGNDAQMFVTAWGGIVDLSTGQVEFVNAGHNPPLVKHGNGKFEYLKSKSGFVLAGLEGFKFTKQTIQLQPGDVIYLYTDGVTEANNPDKVLYSEARLGEVINKSNQKYAKDICVDISKSIHEFVNGAEQSDDITMLCFRLNGNESRHIKVCDAVVDNIPMVTSFVDDLLEKHECNMKAQTQINIAIDEIFSNIARYAYPKGQVGKAKLTVDFNDTKDKVKLIFEDRGIPYNPLLKEDPNAKATLEEREIGGLGIFIVKKTIDSMEYENVNGHNVLTLIKTIK